MIDRLSHGLKTAFPDMTGFSPRHLKYMRKFAKAWPDRAIVQRTVAQLPWRSNLTMVEYSLGGYTKPINVAQGERQMTQSLPDDLKTSLPSIEEIEAELVEANDDE